MSCFLGPFSAGTAMRSRFARAGRGVLVEGGDGLVLLLILILLGPGVGFMAWPDDLQ